MLRNFPPVRVKFGNAVLSESDYVKNLGLVMDRYLTFDQHIDQLVGKCTGMLLAISHARHSLPSDVISTLVTALVVSHIRYCISIYVTFGQDQVHRVQKLLNFCVRVICGRRKFEHITADYSRLGWLSSAQLMTYHRLCFIKRVLTTGHPFNIAQQLSTVDHDHDTRAHGQLSRPRARINAGVRRLCFSGADVYNRVPRDICDRSMPVFKVKVAEWLLRDAG